MALTLDRRKATEPLPSRIIAQSPARRIHGLDKLLGWLPLLALFGVWELVADLGLVRPFLLPALSSVLVRIWADVQEGDLVELHRRAHQERGHLLTWSGPLS